MNITYRFDLEQTAKQMIQIHRVDTLIRLILRRIMQTVHVRHAGIFLFDASRGEYVVRLSRGDTGFRVPQNFVKLKQDSAVVRYFTEAGLPFPREYALVDTLKTYKQPRARVLAKDIAVFAESLRAKLFIPAQFRNELIGIFFLGSRQGGKRFCREELSFLAVLASDAVMALKNARLIEDLNRQLSENDRLFLQTVSALAAGIEAKDIYTMGHTERVTGYALSIAQRLKSRCHSRIGDWMGFLKDLKISAFLHDIGKIGVPESILNKPSFLTPQERCVIEKHPNIGADILKHVEAFRVVLAGVQHHHERFDGMGYPHKLKGKQIPLIASIICLADAYDAMTTDRPYRKALTHEQAMEEVMKNRGAQFAPVVVDAFVKAGVSVGVPHVAAT